MSHLNLITRRSFLSRNLTLGLGVALSSLTNFPFVMKRALAEGSIGLPGPDGKTRKLLFIFLRGANDGLNSVVPVLDPSYNATNRPSILIPTDPATDYSQLGPCDFPVSGPTAGTYAYDRALRLGNGFAALHPSLKFLAPVYNAGQLALLHRVGYPKQSRSHFSSQVYWENGIPGDSVSKDGIFYRTLLESGLTARSALTGVSVQSSLPMLLRGPQAAMTNLTDPTRYNLLGIPNTEAGNLKADQSLDLANQALFADKRNRDLLRLQYQNLASTLDIFAQLDFSENGNTFLDDEATDGDFPYYLFPTTNAKNGGYSRPGGGTDANKYVVPTSGYSFFRNLKAAALILNKTDAVIAGTEMGGFDTHSNQGSTTGTHANLQRRIAWALYALRKYFLRYGDQASWNNLVIVTLSEFGRTTLENSDDGTDHAEAGLMFVAGGAIKGFVPGQRSGVLGCHPGDPIPWATGPSGSMFGVNGRYLKRSLDYRSVLGKLIRDHLGATQAQLNRIIPGYADESRQHLRTGGTVTSPIESSGVETPILGEPDLLLS